MPAVSEAQRQAPRVHSEAQAQDSHAFKRVEGVDDARAVVVGRNQSGIGCRDFYVRGNICGAAWKSHLLEGSSRIPGCLSVVAKNLYSHRPRHGVAMDSLRKDIEPCLN